MIRAHVLLPLVRLGPVALGAQGEGAVGLAWVISSASALAELGMDIRGCGVTGREVTSLI